MKNYFKIGFFVLSAMISSCGSNEDEAAAKKNEVAEKPQYDCECNTLQTESGRKFREMSTKRMMSGGKPYTGTCATLSKDRSKIVTFLAEYKDGYPLKKQKWENFNNEKILVMELSFNDKNKKTGYKINVGRTERLDSSTNTKYSIVYPSKYEEWKEGRSIYSYSFSKYEDPETSYDEMYIGANRIGYRFNSEDEALVKLTEACFPKETVPDPMHYMGDERTMERKIVINNFDLKNPKIKQYFDCVETNKAKIKKWFLKEMKIDEASAVAENDVDVESEEE
jgi:hypothetical protein